jgi:hypothetical protein
VDVSRPSTYNISGMQSMRNKGFRRPRKRWKDTSEWGIQYHNLEEEKNKISNSDNDYVEVIKSFRL